MNRYAPALLLAVLGLASVSFARAQDLAWAGQFSGGLSHGATDVAVDRAGTVYTAGVFLGTVDFDPGPGVYDAVEFGLQRGPQDRLFPSASGIAFKPLAIDDELWINGNNRAPVQSCSS